MAVRMEPFLAVRGRLQKDGDTLNVIAYEVKPLRVARASSRRGGNVRNRVATHPAAESDPFRYLTALRQSPPGIRHFG